MRAARPVPLRAAWRGSASLPSPCRPTRRSSVRPALPSHGRSRTSSTKTVGSDSPSGIAVVIIRSVIPNPLPKCLSPVTAYDRPARNGSRIGGRGGRSRAGDVAAAPRLRRDRSPLLAGRGAGEDRLSLLLPVRLRWIRRREPEPDAPLDASWTRARPMDLRMRDDGRSRRRDGPRTPRSATTRRRIQARPASGGRRLAGDRSPVDPDDVAPDVRRVRRATVPQSRRWIGRGRQPRSPCVGE